MNQYRWLQEHSNSRIQTGIFDFPQAEFDARRGRNPKSVCVIGAGIAGLVAAYELAKAGHSVVVVEAQPRVGGRISTWRQKYQGKLVTGEFGPMRIPPNHKGTLHYVTELGLDLDLFVQRNPNGWLRLRGEKKRLQQWRDFMPSYNADPDNLFPGYPFDISGATFPDDLVQHVLQQAKDSLLSHARWQLMTGGHGPSIDVLGSLTLWQLMMGAHAELAANAGSWLPPLPGTGKPSSLAPFRWFTALGWEFLGRATGNLWDERISALEACVEDVAVHGSLRTRIKDGMDALPEALALQLGNHGVRLELERAVTEVAVEPAARRVRVFAGTREMHPASGDSDHFAYVICAVPAGPTAAIKFDRQLSPDKFEALTNLPLMPASKTLVLSKRRPWEYNDQIFGGASYTDLPIQQVWYPSDNAAPDDAPYTAVAARSADTGALDAWEASPSAFGPRDDQASQDPAVLTAAYMTGINAERFVALSPSQREEQVLSQLELLHPEIRDEVVDIAHCCWPAEPTPVGGAWAFHAPGTHERYQELLAQPHPRDAPRVFFAGEHLCVLHGWMQSAIETGLEAALAVMDAP
jgi:monoamine oxidase